MPKPSQGNTTLWGGISKIHYKSFGNGQKRTHLYRGELTLEFVDKIVALIENCIAKSNNINKDLTINTFIWCSSLRHHYFCTANFMSSILLTPETLNVLYLERNLIFSSIKNLTMFWILPDVRN